MARIPYIRYLRYRVLDRLRHSNIAKAFIDAQADRLSTTREVIFGMLKGGMTAQQVADTPEGDIPGAPTNTEVPTISGTAQTQELLTASPGTWEGDPEPTYTYQWQRGTTDISGATSATYTPVNADAGQTLRVVVTATNDKGSATANSANTAPVGRKPENTALPAITGTTTVGETLTVSNGTWAGSPTPAYTRQWRRDGVNISGATATTYVLVVDDEGTDIDAVVTATNSAGATSATASAVGPIAPAA